MHTVVIFLAANGTTSQEFRVLQTTLVGQRGWRVKSATKEGEFSGLLRECTPSLILAIVSPTGSTRTLESLTVHPTSSDPSVAIMPVLPEGGSLGGSPIPEPAADFLIAPLRPKEALTRIQRVLDQEKKHSMAESCLHLTECFGLETIIGEHPGVVAVKSKLPLMARAEATVPISGETGTGKKVVARAIHYLSRRAHAPFLPVKCGAVPPNCSKASFSDTGEARSPMRGPQRPDSLPRPRAGRCFSMRSIPSLSRTKSWAPLSRTQDLPVPRRGFLPASGCVAWKAADRPIWPNPFLVSPGKLR